MLANLNAMKMPHLFILLCCNMKILNNLIVQLTIKDENELDSIKSVLFAPTMNLEAFFVTFNR